MLSPYYYGCSIAHSNQKKPYTVSHPSIFPYLGLFLCGQDVMCCGFVSAMLSGLLCASAVLKTNLFNDLILLHKKVKAASAQSQRNKRD